MPDRYLYVFVDTLCLLFPLIFSFHRKIRFYTQWVYFTLPCVITAVIFIAWDIIFTARGIWSFNPRYVLGVYIAGLPVEEVLFFFCIPYACVFTYYTISTMLETRPWAGVARYFTIFLAVCLLLVGGIFREKLYTAVTFLFLSAILVVLTIRRVTFLGMFYVVFWVTLLPFYLSNGVLTGSFTPEPVVSYNSEHILGIRTLTIPLEDIFYGMALLLMNVAGFEYMRTRARADHS